MATRRATKGGRRQSERRRAILLISVVGVLLLSLLVLWLWGRQTRRAAWAPSVDAGLADSPILDDLPETPSREDVGDSLRALRPFVGLCNTKGEAGVLRVHLTIKGATGTVTEATVAKQFAGTDLARCATALVEKAQFPRFRQERFTVVYPFVLAGRDSGPGGDGGAGGEGDVDGGS